MRIVTNGKGEYAVQKGIFFKKYYNLKHGCWWGCDSMFFLGCWGQKKDVENIYFKLNPNPSILDGNFLG